MKKFLAGISGIIFLSISGIALLGPVGIVASLVGANQVDQNPCPCALNIARDGTDETCSKAEKKSAEAQKPKTEESANPLKKILSIFD